MYSTEIKARYTEIKVSLWFPCGVKHSVIMAEFANHARSKSWTAKRIPTPTNHSHTQYSHTIDLINGELMAPFYCLIFVSVC